MSEITHITADTFQKEVIDSSIPVVVDFTAVWCGPCKMLEPIIEELAQEWDSSVKVVKLDVDNNADIAMKFRVMSVPTLMLFLDGEPKERITGYQPKKRILKKFATYFD